MAEQQNVVRNLAGGRREESPNPLAVLRNESPIQADGEGLPRLFTNDLSQVVLVIFRAGRKAVWSFGEQ